MTKNQHDNILAHDETLHSYPTYSGRGAMGKTTHAVYGDESDVLEAVVKAGYSIKEFKRDNLGRDTIIY